jgi:hypothetical protein
MYSRKSTKAMPSTMATTSRHDVPLGAGPSAVTVATATSSVGTP